MTRSQVPIKPVIQKFAFSLQYVGDVQGSNLIYMVDSAPRIFLLK
jgi:hypothetical protein